jgi:hypothetical protein
MPQISHSKPAARVRTRRTWLLGILGSTGGRRTILKVTFRVLRPNEGSISLIKRVNREEGIVILPVGQNVQEALELAHYAYVPQTDRIVMEGKPADLLQTDMIKKACLGL